MKQFTLLATLLALTLLAGCEKPTNEATNIADLSDTEKIWEMTVCFQLENPTPEKKEVLLFWSQSDGGFQDPTPATRQEKLNWYCANLNVSNVLRGWGQAIVRVKLHDSNEKITNMVFLPTSNPYNGIPYDWPIEIYSTYEGLFRRVKRDEVSRFYIHPIVRDDVWTPEGSLVIYPRRQH